MTYIVIKTSKLYRNPLLNPEVRPTLRRVYYLPMPPLIPCASAEGKEIKPTVETQPIAILDVGTLLKANKDFDLNFYFVGEW